MDSREPGHRGERKVESKRERGPRGPRLKRAMRAIVKTAGLYRNEKLGSGGGGAGEGKPELRKFRVGACRPGAWRPVDRSIC